VFIRFSAFVRIPVSLASALPRHAVLPLASPGERKPPASAADWLPSPKLAGVSLASRLEVRLAPEMAASGVPALDRMTGGLPRGCLTEIFGPASSGRTSVLLTALAAATHHQETCVLVDAGDAFDPLSATAAGVDLTCLLWTRCNEKSSGKRNPNRSPIMNRLDQTLRIIDLVLQSGGFGIVAIDLGDIPLTALRRIPLASWFRFRRTVEHTPTILLVTASAPCAPSCASLSIQLRANATYSQNKPAHAQLVPNLRIEGELLRSRLPRKPVHSATANFSFRGSWENLA